MIINDQSALSGILGLTKMFFCSEWEESPTASYLHHEYEFGWPVNFRGVAIPRRVVINISYPSFLVSLSTDQPHACASNPSFPRSPIPSLVSQNKNFTLNYLPISTYFPFNNLLCLFCPISVMGLRSGLPWWAKSLGPSIQFWLQRVLIKFWMCYGERPQVSLVEHWIFCIVMLTQLENRL